MQQNAAFHQGLHFLLRSKQSYGTEMHHYLEISTCDPFKYIMDNLFLIAFICMGKSIRIQRVNCEPLATCIRPKWLSSVFIHRHFKKCGVLCYTLHSKNCVRVSVCLSISLFVCPSVRQSDRQHIIFTLCWEHFLTNFLQTCYGSWYWEVVSWDCRWVNFGK